MIVYGTGSGNSVVGPMGEHECPACKQNRTFSAICQFSYFHIWWLASLVTGRKYFIVCDSCQHGTAVDKSTIRQHFKKDNISLFRRFGLILIPLLLIIVFIVWGTIESRSRAQRAAKSAQALAEGMARAGQYAEAPQVGDLFLTNLYFIPDSGFGANNPEIKKKTAWGVLRVVEVGEGAVTCVTSTRAWDSRIKLLIEVLENKVEYDFADELEFGADDLKTWAKGGVIADARRK